MAFNNIYTTVMGGLGNVGDLKELSNNNAVINFSLATTERVKNASGQYEDGATKWTNVSLWGRDARAFADAKFAKGTQLAVYGRVTARDVPARTTQDGTELPARTMEQVNADFVAVVVSPFTQITVNRIQNANGAPVQPQAQQPVQAQPARQATPVAPQAPAQPQKPASQPAPTEDPFADMTGAFGGDDGFDTAGGMFPDDDSAPFDEDVPF